MSDHTSLVTKKAQALHALSLFAKELAPLLQRELGHSEADATLGALPAELMRLLALMPDPGWRAPQLRAFGISGAIYIALYLQLKQRGKTAAQVWELCEQASRSQFLNMSALSRKLLSWATFSLLWKYLSRSLAQRTQSEVVGGWQLDYFPRQTGEFDYGVSYRRCAIFQLAQDAGAQEFAPFICQADIVASELLGWGLLRTETLAQGGKQCDFRFRRHQATAVRVKLPVLP
jgi:hypothetical protein